MKEQIHLTNEDISLLESLDFIEHIPEEEDQEDNWIFYFRSIKNHEFLGDIYLSVEKEGGEIEVEGPSGDIIITKPFSKENLLAVLTFLQVTIPENIRT